MKSIKLFFLAILALVAVGFAACSDDDFKPGPGVEGAQVYFPETISSQLNIDEEDTSLTIPVKRISAEGALNVPILADDASGLFTIPSSVTFEAGKQTADLVITFDNTKLESDMEYPLAFLINDESNTTPYGNRRLDVTVAIWPWKLMEANEGIGKYRDDYLSAMWSGLPAIDIDVKVYEHKTKPGIYMVEEMFGEDLLTTIFEASLEDLSSTFTYTPTNITIDASNPDKVLIPEQWTGIDMKANDYGLLSIMTIAYGTLSEGVITFPANGLGMNVGNIHEPGRGVYANKSGLFRIVLPGYEAVDYSLAATYDGMKVSADGETASAVIEFTYGNDVTGINYVFAPGDVTAEAAAYAARIADGTAENIVQVPDFVAGEGSISIQAELDAAGSYTIIAVPNDKNSASRVKEVAATAFYFPGLGGSQIPDVDADVELMSVSEFNPTLVERYPEHSSLACAISGTELVAVKYYLNSAELVSLLEAGDPSLPSTNEVMEQYANDLSAAQLKLIEDNGYWGGIFSNLKASSSYRMIIQAKNTYGKTAIFYSQTATTADVPYAGELVVGKYTMEYVADPQNVFTNIFTVMPTANSVTKFQVLDIGCDNEGSVWNAVYDPTASTLTLDGTLAGEEAEGSYFGKIMGYWDSARSMAYGFYSYANEESKGTDPLVIEVNASTKQLSVLKNQFQVPVISISDNVLQGYGGLFPFDTPISLYTGSSSAAPTMQGIRSVQIPFSSIRVPAVEPNLSKVRFGTKVAVSVSKSAVAGNGLRTLSVRSQKCEPLPKQFGRRISLGNSTVQAVK